MLQGRRPYYGLDRRWEGDYLKDVITASTAMLNLKAKDQFSDVVYASRMRKFNKHFKSSERALLITDTFIYKLDGKTFKSMSSKIPYADVTTLLTFNPFTLNSFKLNNLLVDVGLGDQTQRQLG